jgi:glucokinase
LSDLYEFCSGGKHIAASDVARLAVEENDETASRALMYHYRYLVRCAQNLCVTLLLKDGIFFAGDNGVANAPWLRRHVKELHEEFFNHHKKDWIQHTPLFVQTKEINFNLMGAIYQAEMHFK